MDKDKNMTLAEQAARELREGLKDLGTDLDGDDLALITAALCAAEQRGWGVMEFSKGGKRPELDACIREMLLVMMKHHDKMNGADALSCLGQVAGNILAAMYGDDEKNIKAAAYTFTDLLPIYAKQWRDMALAAPDAIRGGQ